MSGRTRLAVHLSKKVRPLEREELIEEEDLVGDLVFEEPTVSE